MTKFYQRNESVRRKCVSVWRGRECVWAEGCEMQTIRPSFQINENKFRTHAHAVECLACGVLLLFALRSGTFWRSSFDHWIYVSVCVWVCRTNLGKIYFWKGSKKLLLLALLLLLLLMLLLICFNIHLKEFYSSDVGIFFYLLFLPVS